MGIHLNPNKILTVCESIYFIIIRCTSYFSQSHEKIYFLREKRNSQTSFITTQPSRMLTFSFLSNDDIPWERKQKRKKEKRKEIERESKDGMKSVYLIHCSYARIHIAHNSNNKIVSRLFIPNQCNRTHFTQLLQSFLQNVLKVSNLKY